jgi:hypothetical protein
MSQGDSQESDTLDIPLSADEVLVQRYLDGDLSDSEGATFDLRLDADPSLRALLDEANGLFAALASSALARSALLWSNDLPEGLVERAIDRWQDDRAAETAAATELPDFSGWLQPGRVLVAANVLLLVVLSGIALRQGPTELAKTWVLSAKDLLFFVASHAPSADQMAYGVPTVLVACIAGLLSLGAFARSLLRRGR